MLLLHWFTGWQPLSGDLRQCSGCAATINTSAIGRFNTVEDDLGRALLEFVANPR